MKCGDQIDIDLLCMIIDYNPETGLMVWKFRSPCMFEDSASRSKEHICKNWNSIHAGKQCFTHNHNAGYKMGTIWNVKYLAHRIAWALYYGSWPDDMIDHINLDKSDNRINNLRCADMAKNKHNMGITIANTSGYKGVSLCKHTGRWIAGIKHNGNYVWLGRHANPEEAHKAYAIASKKYHGEFGRTE